MRNPTERIVELEPERPEGEWNFDQEERRDDGRNLGEHLQPGRVAFDPTITFGV